MVINSSFSELNGWILILVGDFNLDDNQRYSMHYHCKDLFDLLNEMTERLGLFQFIEFDTWERVVQNTIKSSILDHIYAKDSNSINIKMKRLF